MYVANRIVLQIVFYVQQMAICVEHVSDRQLVYLTQRKHCYFRLSNPVKSACVLLTLDVILVFFLLANVNAV